MIDFKIQNTLSYFIVAMFFAFPAFAEGTDLGGVWTKTTHPDPQNIALFYMDDKTVKAIGFGIIAGRQAIWHAQGTSDQKQVVLEYRYSAGAVPDGWEPGGTMQLEVSEDGKKMHGMATSSTGGWSDKIEFVRLSSNVDERI